jgi:hypothetical protein
VLVQSGASPHAWNMDGHTPIVHAAVGRHLAATSLLEEYEDAVGLVPDPALPPAPPHPARWIHRIAAREAARARVAHAAAHESEEAKLERVMAVWNAFFERALGGGGAAGGPRRSSVGAGGTALTPYQPLSGPGYGPGGWGAAGDGGYGDTVASEWSGSQDSAGWWWDDQGGYWWYWDDVSASWQPWYDTYSVSGGIGAGAGAGAGSVPPSDSGVGGGWEGWEGSGGWGADWGSGYTAPDWSAPSDVGAEWAQWGGTGFGAGSTDASGVAASGDGSEWVAVEGAWYNTWTGEYWTG